MRSRPRIHFALLFVLAAALAHSQTTSPPATPTTPVAIENTNAAFVPTDVSIPQANPSRPTITSPARIPPSGYLQFENGVNFAGSSPGGTNAQTALNQATKISLTTRLQVQLLSQPYTYNVTDVGPSSSDPGDLAVGAQYVLYEAAGVVPVVSIGYVRRVRLGTAANLDIGDYSQYAILLLSSDLPHDLHCDLNFFLDEQGSVENGVTGNHPTRRGQFGQTLSFSHPLFSHATSGRLAFVFEISHFAQPFVSTPSVRRAQSLDLLFGPTFSIRPNIIFDVNLSPGLTSTSTGWQGGFGVTYLLPHRLWPDRHPVVLQTASHKPTP